MDSGEFRKEKIGKLGLDATQAYETLPPSGFSAVEKALQASRVFHCCSDFPVFSGRFSIMVFNAGSMDGT